MNNSSFEEVPFTIGEKFSCFSVLKDEIQDEIEDFEKANCATELRQDSIVGYVALNPSLPLLLEDFILTLLGLGEVLLYTKRTFHVRSPARRHLLVT